MTGDGRATEESLGIFGFKPVFGKEMGVFVCCVGINKSPQQKRDHMPRILIIDDEESLREILGVYSEMLGCEVELAADPSLCKSFHSDSQECTNEKPCADILVIDQNLPDLKGLDLIRQQTERGCKLPPQRKAVISASLSEDEFRQAKNLGCHVMQKPITFEIFESWLQKLEEKA